MTTNHIDQLTEWWNEATPGIPKKGDTYIEDERHRGRSFRIVEAATDHKYGFDNIRILSRAPKPKPAWHDAPAVIATYRDERGMVSGAWVREGKPGYWEGPEGDVVASEALEDVVPLIEAKVTDEMVERVLDVLHAWNDTYPAGIGTKLAAAALGLETE